MSKIGRKSINISNIKVEIKGNEIHYNGAKGSGVYVLPDVLTAQINGNELTLVAKDNSREVKKVWGLHRALLANCLQGASTGFERKVIIDGLGYKAAVSGSKVVFSLGFSHKIDFELPQGVTLEVDKTGQKLTFKSSDKALVGHVCSMVKALRPPEPYKGTGIKFATEVIIRKAGKTKAS